MSEAETLSAVPASGAADDERALLRWRDEFPILADSTYLISNSLGAMPRGVGPALAEYAETWSRRGVRAWEDSWWLLPQRVGDGIGGIIGAPAGTVSTHQNVTIASAVLASCFDFTAERPKVVCSDLNFPSIVQLYRGQERRGAEICLVESPDGFTVPLEAMLEAIDERTLLVPISHVIFRSGFMQDAAAIVDRAHEVGATVVLDIYQSAGVMPIDVSELGVDFAVGGVLKWMCGGPGVGYLYARPDRIPGVEPSLTGWFGRRAPFAFDPHDDSYSDDAWRFLNGTTHIPSLTAAVPGLEILSELDLQAVRRKSSRQTRWLIEAASERGWKVNTPSRPDLRGGHVVIDVPGAEAITRELLERRIMVDYRPGAGIRMAPHFYTSDEELEHAVETLAELCAAQ